MKLWWCVECQTKVALGRHGQCEICESEAVDLLPPDGELDHPDAAARTNSESAPACA